MQRDHTHFQRCIRLFGGGDGWSCADADEIVEGRGLQKHDLDLRKRHTSLPCLNATIACQSQFRNPFQVSAMSVCCAWAKNNGLMSWGC